MSALQAYAGQLLEGICTTLQLACASLCIGLLLGLALAACQLSGWSGLRRVVALVTSGLRGVPEFLIVLVCYFGITNYVNEHWNGAVDISPLGAGVCALSLVFSVYACEVFRGSLLAVAPGQLDAARALGLSGVQTFFSIRLPQAWRIALPSLGNLWQSLLKDTSLVSVVGLEDLLKKGTMAAQATHQPFLFYITVAVAYFVLLLMSAPVFSHLERRAQRPYARGSVR